MRIAHQVAQKLHGATDKDYVRPQDVIDLQLMMMRENVDLSEVKLICKRLFANRKKQPWPPTLEVGQEWRDSYTALASPLAVFSSADEAIIWTNDLIRRVDTR